MASSMRMPFSTQAGVMNLPAIASGPTGFSCAAEVAYPAPEGTSNGRLLMMGQISGIAFIVGMDALKSLATGSMTRTLVELVGLMVLGLILCARLRESALIAGDPGS